jgi:hypothetical protein
MPATTIKALVKEALNQKTPAATEGSGDGRQDRAPDRRPQAKA